MQTAAEASIAPSVSSDAIFPDSAAPQSPYSPYKVIRRIGPVGGFEPSKITVATTKAFLAVNECRGAINPFPSWMSGMIDLNKERNFFETRVIEYQTGGALSWD